MGLKLTLLTVTGNLIGAVLTFLYFSYINTGADKIHSDSSSIHYIIYFIIATGLIFLVVILFSQRWSRPLDNFLTKQVPINDMDEYAAESIRRKALHMIPMMAGASPRSWRPRRSPRGSSPNSTVSGSGSRPST